MRADIKNRYTVLVDFLGRALGPDYEVVLHEVGSESSGIVAIANNSVSGRTVGGPVTGASLKMIMQRIYEQRDFILNYTGKLENGKTIRSSTMFIKDKGELVGLLCINFDDSRFHELSDSLFRLIHPDNFVYTHYFPETATGGVSVETVGQSVAASIERFQDDIPGLMSEIFDEVMQEYDVPVDRLNQEERQKIISMLVERGMFQLKGAVPFIVEKLSCSQASIYRYLSKVKACNTDLQNSRFQKK